MRVINPTVQEVMTFLRECHPDAIVCFHDEAEPIGEENLSFTEIEYNEKCTYINDEGVVSEGPIVIFKLE